MKKLNENLFIQKWEDSMLSKLKNIYPNTDVNILHKLLRDEVVKNIKNPRVVIKNTYVRKESQTNLLSIVDFLLREKPIICANGSFYRRQDQDMAPTTKMISFQMDNRKAIKHEMFKYIKEGNIEMADNKNLAQNNEKIKTNSSYGAMGCPSSFTYNVSTAGAITGQGRSIISTTMWCTEYFIANNIKFDNFDDLLVYVTNIVQENNNENMRDIITYIPEDIKLIKYLMSKLTYKSTNPRLHAATILKILKKCDPITKAKLYYKNNILEFVRQNTPIRNLISNMLDLPGVEFCNPYEIPETYVPGMTEFTNLLLEYVYYPHIVYDKVHKYKHYHRKAVIGSDTDSVFINLGPWTFSIADIHMQTSNVVKNVLNDNQYAFKIVNIITNILQIIIHNYYKILCTNVNMLPEYHKRISIKSEYLFDKFILFASTKKNYIFRKLLKEGELLDPPEFGTTGGNLNSKSKNKQVSKRIQTILQECLITPDKVEPVQLLGEIFRLKNDIIESLKRGEITYLEPSKIKSHLEYKPEVQTLANVGEGFNVTAKVGELLEYERNSKNEVVFNRAPLKIKKFRGYLTYIIATGDMVFSPPAPTNIVDLIELTKVEQLDLIKDSHPGIYNNLVNGFFGDSLLKTYGISTMSLPVALDRIPEWLAPYIDYEGIARKHISPLITLLPSVGIHIDNIRQNNYYSTVLNV